MLKALIVDDEYLVISGLMNCIDWHQLGIETPMSASNGEEALAVMTTHQVDILITDIAMTPIDGIALMDEVRRLGYDTEIIVLSCYNDFEYSRKAMQNDACDYLFKPAMMPEEITKAIATAKDNLLKKRSSIEKLSLLEQQVSQGRKIGIQQFIADILEGKRISQEDARRQYNAFEMRIPFSNLQVLVLKTGLPIDEHELKDGEYLLRYEISNALEEIAETYCGMLISLSKSEYIVLVEGWKETEQLAFEMLSVVQNFFKLRCGCGISEAGFSLENLRTAYEQAYTMADRMFVLGLYKVGRFDEDIVSDNKEKLMEQAFAILHSAEGKHYTEKLRIIFTKLRQRKQVSLSFLNELSANMIMQMMKEAMFNHEALGYLYSKQGKIFSKFTTFTNIDEFQDYILQIAKDMEEFSKNNCRDEIYVAKNYIIENMSDANLTIEQVAHHVNLSKNYFSYLFKKNTNKTFTEFLTEVRVEKAAELYKTSGLKIYQIAELVGYTDWRYLTKVFKKIKGKNLTDL